MLPNWAKCTTAPSDSRPSSRSPACACSMIYRASTTRALSALPSAYAPLDLNLRPGLLKGCGKQFQLVGNQTDQKTGGDQSLWHSLSEGESSSLPVNRAKQSVDARRCMFQPTDYDLFFRILRSFNGCTMSKAVPVLVAQLERRWISQRKAKPHFDTVENPIARPLSIQFPPVFTRKVRA